MKLAEAYVDITARTGKFMRGLANVRNQMKRVMSGIAQMAKRMAVLVAASAAAIVLAMRKAIQAAGDMLEIQSKFNVVFGKHSKAADRWANTFAKAVGRARQDVKRWMSGIQDILVPMGLARKEAMGLSQAIVQLAVDVGSFSNVASEDVLRDFTSALVGNHETVRKYGIMIDENKMKQAAWAMGLGKNLKALTAAQRLQVRYNIIVASSTDAMTDATRTALGYANQMQRLRGNIKNVAETIGKSLIGSATRGLIGLNKWIEKNERAWGIWAQKAVVHVKYFAGILKNFWQETDFKGKFQAMIDSILIMLKAFVRAAAVLAMAAGKGIVVGIERGIESKLDRITGGMRTEYIGKPRGLFGMLGRELRTVSKEEVARRRAKEDEAIVSPAFAEVAEIMAEAMGKINNSMSSQLSLWGRMKEEQLGLIRQYRLWFIELAPAVSLLERAMDGFRKSLERTEPAVKKSLGAWWKEVSDAFKVVWGEVRIGFAQALAKQPIPEWAKAKERPTPEFVGLEEAWKRVQVAAFGKISPEKIQQNQLTVMKKQEKHQQKTASGIGTLIDWFKSASPWALQ